MKKISLGLLTALLEILLMCPHGFCVELTYQYIEGAESKYSVVTSITQTIAKEDSVDPMINVAESITMSFTEVVDSIINPTTARISTTFDSIIAQAQVGGETYAYDSTSANDPDYYFASLSGLINKVITTEATNKGETIEVSGLTTMQDEMINAAKTESTIEDTYNPDQTANNIVQSLNWHFPDGDISLNDTWQRQMTLPFPQTDTLNIDSTFTLKSIETVNEYECAKIEVSMTLKAQPITSSKILSIDGSDVDAQNEIIGSGSGHIYFAYQEGLLVKSDINLSLSMNTAMSMIIKGRPYFNTYNTNSNIAQILNLTQHTTP